jgi:NAD(P)-dependent dehydrogenase (short-subunit alcohol dehydrogenase family)
MSSTTGTKIWLVTGASQGLGLAISLAAVAAGHKVIACARNTDKAKEEHPELVERGGQWLKLDVTSKDTEQIVRDAIDKEGKIDVVVNNAGYTVIGSVEDLRLVEPYNHAEDSH